jgi:hypothetical protein
MLMTFYICMHVYMYGMHGVCVCVCACVCVHACGQGPMATKGIKRYILIGNHYSYHAIFQKMFLYDIPFNILPMYRYYCCARIYKI